MTFSRAGHPHPMVLRQGRDIESVECKGGLLGVFPDEIYGQATIDLNIGDRLLLVTDGVEVAFGGDIATSQQRWLEELQKRKDLPAEQFLEQFGDLIDSPNDDVALRDDLTMLMLEIR